VRRRASGGRPPAPPNVGFARRNLKCSILDRSTVPPFEAKLMSDYWIWWIAAALLVGAELLTGTYYLLAVGLALGIGGLAAWLGASAPAQLAVAAVAGVLATIAAHQWRMRRALPPPQPGLDIGQPVRGHERGENRQHGLGVSDRLCKCVTSTLGRVDGSERTRDDRQRVDAR